MEGTRGGTVMRGHQRSYIPPHDGPAVQANTGTETGAAPALQLYDLSADIGQGTNVIAEQPAIAERLRARLEAIRAGTSTREA